MVTPTHSIKALLPGVFLALVALATALPAQADDFDDLVAAERAFAADASARSTRDAFLAALADDGLVFSPAGSPVAGQAVWQARVADKSHLEWAPELAEVAASGDLGYTSGPWQYTPEGADKPSAFGHFFSVWKKQADGHWQVLIDHGIEHGQLPFPDKVVRRGSVSAGTPPQWTVGIAELRKAELAPAGQLTAAMVSADFLRLRAGRLPDGAAEGEGFDASKAMRVDTGLIISKAGDLAVTWGGGAASPSWIRVWRRPTAGDRPGLGWRLAVDLSLAAAKPSE